MWKPQSSAIFWGATVPARSAGQHDVVLTVAPVSVPPTESLSRNWPTGWVNPEHIADDSGRKHPRQQVPEASISRIFGEILPNRCVFQFAAGERSWLQAAHLERVAHVECAWRIVALAMLVRKKQCVGIAYYESEHTDSAGGNLGRGAEPEGRATRSRQGREERLEAGVQAACRLARRAPGIEGPYMGSPGGTTG